MAAWNREVLFTLLILQSNLDGQQAAVAAGEAVSPEQPFFPVFHIRPPAGYETNQQLPNRL